MTTSNDKSTPPLSLRQNEQSQAAKQLARAYAFILTWQNSEAERATLGKATKEPKEDLLTNVSDFENTGGNTMTENENRHVCGVAVNEKPVRVARQPFNGQSITLASPSQSGDEQEGQNGY